MNQRFLKKHPCAMGQTVYNIIDTEVSRADILEFVGEGKGIRDKGKGNAGERQNL